MRLERQRNVSVPLSGLTSINKKKSLKLNCYLYCFRPLIGVNFYKLFMKFDAKTVDLIAVSVPLSGLTSINKMNVETEDIETTEEFPSPYRG